MGSWFVDDAFVGLLTQILDSLCERACIQNLIADCPVLTSNHSRMLPQATRHAHPGGFFQIGGPMEKLAKMCLLRWGGGKGVDGLSINRV